ncbi:transmembrane protein [Cystoisospora suis]|uniref:Transmembrane protein n=1 Tax=Cystoisospora suis TaxID=483139 RepID=A0A2C6KTC2_9APIC|nr:transmembrane protein [Cystoisospora suis]
MHPRVGSCNCPLNPKGKGGGRRADRPGERGVRRVSRQLASIVAAVALPCVLHVLHQAAGDPCSAASSTVCANGSCYSNNGLDVCVCELPWTGVACDQAMSLCTKDCGVKTDSGLDCQTALCGLGKCTDSNVPPYYSCECGDFYSGVNCEIQSNPCSSASSNPCAHGTCSFAPGKNSGTVTCVCEAGWVVPQGATGQLVKWGNSEVHMGPACTEQEHRGVARLAVTLSSGEMIIWWIIFAISLIVLVWCCYTVCAETCSKYMKAFSKMRAAGAVAR